MMAQEELEDETQVVGSRGRRKTPTCFDDEVRRRSDREVCFEWDKDIDLEAYERWTNRGH